MTWMGLLMDLVLCLDVDMLKELLHLLDLHGHGQQNAERVGWAYMRAKAEAIDL
jgi:hypothetical protein